MNSLLTVAVAMALQLTPVGHLPQNEFATEIAELSEEQRASLHLALVGVVHDATPIEISPFRYVGGIPIHARATLESSAASGPMRILWIADCTYDPAAGQWGCDPPAEIRIGLIDGVQETIEVDGEFPAQTLLEIVRWLRDTRHNPAPAAEILRLKLTGNPLGRHRVTAQYRDAQGVVHTDHLESNLPRHAGYSDCYGGFRLSEKPIVPEEFSRPTLEKLIHRRYQLLRFGNFVVVPDPEGPLVVPLGITVSIRGGPWPDCSRYLPITAYRLNGETLEIEPLPVDILERLRRAVPVHDGLRNFLDLEPRQLKLSVDTAIALEFAGRELPSIEEFRRRIVDSEPDPGQEYRLWMALGHLYGERDQLELARHAFSGAQAALGESWLRLPAGLSVDLELAFVLARRLQTDEASAAAEPVWRTWRRYDRWAAIAAYGLPLVLVWTLVWPAKKPIVSCWLLVLTIALTFAHAALFNVLCLTGKTGSMGSRFFVANLVSDHSFLGLFLSGFSSGLFPRQPLAAFGGGLLELCITFCPLLFLRLRRYRGDSRPGCRLWGAQGIMIAIKVVVGAVFVYLAAAAGGGP